MSLTTAVPHPAFVMFGAQVDENTVVLYASDSLTVAELSTVADDMVRFCGPYDVRIHLTTVMLGATVVRGSTFADALATLLRTWNPDASDTSPRPDARVLPPSQTVAGRELTARMAGEET